MERIVCANCSKVYNAGIICECRKRRHEDIPLDEMVKHLETATLGNWKKSLEEEEKVKALLHDAIYGSPSEENFLEKNEPSTNEQKIEISKNADDKILELPKLSIDFNPGSVQKTTEKLSKTTEKPNASNEPPQEEKKPANSSARTHQIAAEKPKKSPAKSDNANEPTFNFGAKKKTTNQTTKSKSPSCKSPSQVVAKKDDSSPGAKKKETASEKSNNSMSPNNEIKESNNSPNKVKKNNDDLDMDDYVFIDLPEEGNITNYRKRLYERFLRMWCQAKKEDYEDENKMTVEFTLDALNMADKMGISKETLESICKSRGTSFWKSSDEPGYHYNDYESLRIFKERVLYLIGYKDRLRAEREGASGEATTEKKPIVEPEPEMFEIDMEEDICLGIPNPKIYNKSTTIKRVSQPIPVPQPDYFEFDLVEAFFKKNVQIRNYDFGHYPEQDPNLVFRGTQFAYPEGISGLYDKRGHICFNKSSEKYAKIPDEEEPFVPFHLIDTTDYKYPLQLSLKEVIDGSKYAIIVREDGQPGTTMASAFWRVPQFPPHMTEKEKIIAMYKIVRAGQKRQRPMRPAMKPPVEVQSSIEMSNISPTIISSLASTEYKMYLMEQNRKRELSSGKIKPDQVHPDPDEAVKDFTSQMTVKSVPNTKKPTFEMTIPGVVITAPLNLPEDGLLGRFLGRGPRASAEADPNSQKSSPSPPSSKSKAAGSPSKGSEGEVLHNIENKASANGHKNGNLSPSQNGKNGSEPSGKSPRKTKD